MLYKSFLKPLLFLLSPESAHHFIVTILKNIMKIPGGEWLLRKMYVVQNSSLKKNIHGIIFPNPVGLAAGFDKNARYIHSMSALGFGFVEIGTVTPLPQPGNERPRLFRLSKDQALINRMGFNNEGVDVIVSRLKMIDRNNIVIGGNIGKNKSTPLEKAVDDYEICFRKLFECVDYFAVNVSSPNTPGLRTLQEKEPLTKILSKLQEVNNENVSPKPIFLKISPDLNQAQLDDVVDMALQTRLAGIIVSNTTTSRNNLSSDPNQIEKLGQGGLSGKPLAKRSTEMIRYIAQKSGRQLAIIGVGGIHSAEDALEKINAGADLIEIYTGLIFEGPGLIKQINRLILKTDS